MTGLFRSTIYAEIAKGKFPKKVKLTGARSVGWYENVVVEWVESRKKA
ncbi:MAG: AlpA family phage regulatory protein [Porticoccaceae bacterium]